MFSSVVADRAEICYGTFCPWLSFYNLVCERSFSLGLKGNDKAGGIQL